MPAPPKDTPEYERWIRNLSESHKRSKKVQKMLRDRNRSPEHKRHLSRIQQMTRKPLKQGYCQLTEDLAYIVGVLMGDGHLAKDRIILNSVDAEFVGAFYETIQRQFGRSASIYQVPAVRKVSPSNGKTYLCQPQVRLQFASVEAVTFLEGVRSSDWVSRLPVKYKIAWLRGIWDSEGSITKAKVKNHWMVAFAIRNETLAALYQQTLAEALSITATLTKSKNQMWVVYFGKLHDVVRFYHGVQPTIQRKRARFEEAEDFGKTA